MKGALIGAVLAAFLAAAFTIAPSKPEHIPYNSLSEAETGTAVRFLGGDGKTMLTGHWSLPNKSGDTDGNRIRVPVILLAHGLGLVQGKSLSSFVSAFQNEGYAVVTFDYATFGQSDGLPRHQIHPTSHVSDIRAAIAMIKEQGSKRGVDTSRIGLWGTSLGGGHVLLAAVDADPSVKAIVSQVPHIASGLETVAGALMALPVETCMAVAKFSASLVRWAIMKLLLQKPAYFPIVGEPGSAAIMQNPGDEAGYLGILNPGAEVSSGWKNAATTESGLRLLLYRPLSSISRIQLPVLLIAAEHDTLCPTKFIKAAKERIANAELYIFSNSGHFDIYEGEHLQTMLSKQTEFFQKHI